MKTGALLFLLAAVVAASQVDLNLSVTLQSGETDLNVCPINFYGKKSTKVEAFFRPDSSFAVCFKNLAGETAQECLSVENHGGADTVVVEEHLTQTNPGSQLHHDLPNFLTSSTCYVQLSLQDENVTYIVIRLYNFGLQTAMKVSSFDTYTMDTVDVRTEMGNLSLGSWSYDSTVQNSVYMDISGCRQAGVFLPAGTSISDPESCVVSHCNSSAQFSVGGCEPPQVCNGNTCIQPAFVCTVTGSTVIDFFNRVHSVPDRCAYHLTGFSEFDVYAGFRERHLKDVPFLDHLIIYVVTEELEIYLEQGGRVRVNDQILTLSTTAQLFYGVEFSKDQTGVTVKLPSSEITIHFDGNTAHVTGPDKSPTGLCGNPTDESQTTSPSDLVASFFFPAGCEIQHSEAVDSTVDCSRSTDLCDLMNQAPFTACHDHIDPEPYIAACTSTSCKYTPVDDLPCRYMEAYAEACFLRVDVTVGDWRSKAGCSAAPQASCLDQYCSDHEFCEEKLGEARCLCRALFASKYQSTDTLGD